MKWAAGFCAFRDADGAEKGRMDIAIQDLIPAQKVRWKFLGGPKEWIGTEVVFDLYREDEFTIVLFQHLDWEDDVEFKAHCSMKWAIFLLSLKQFVETGSGSPAPHDLKIDNWN